MLNRNLFLILFTIAIVLACSPSETSSEIQPADIKKHINYLASDNLAGRETGTKGEDLACRYLADHFAEYGLEPAGDNYMEVLNTLSNGDRTTVTTLRDNHERTFDLQL